MRRILGCEFQYEIRGQVEQKIQIHLPNAKPMHLFMTKTDLVAKPIHLFVTKTHLVCILNYIAIIQDPPTM